MADWDFETPSYVHRIVEQPSATLIARFDDGTEIRRNKSTASPRTLRQRYSVDKTTADSMLDFFDTNGLHTTFTAKTYDPRDPVDTEGTFRFADAPRCDQVGYDLYHLEFELIEVL